MIISYLGHSCFKIKGKRGTVVFDPYQASVGFSLPAISADIVTSSHDHSDHNDLSAIAGTSRRNNPFLITKPGEYEVGGISVFGVGSYHDDAKGAERGSNTIYTAYIDDVRVCHLGDLGHELTPEMIEEIGAIDVLLCPVGGVFTIDAATAVKVTRSLEPSIVIPMHYRTDQHNQDTFGELKTVDDFLKEYSVEVSPMMKLDIDKTRLPEETEVVVLEPQLM